MVAMIGLDLCPSIEQEDVTTGGLEAPSSQTSVLALNRKNPLRQVHKILIKITARHQDRARRSYLLSALLT